MKQLYFLSHQNGYQAFEDYYLSLQRVIQSHFEVQIIIYSNPLEIPVPITGREIYCFVNNIPSKFLQLYLSGQHDKIYVINTEQVTRPVWTMLLQKYTRIGLNLCDYDLYQTQLTQQMMPEKKVHYLPYQITKHEDQHLNMLLRTTPKRYQVCLCSTNKSKKRMTLFSQLEQRGLKVVDIEGWREDRDRRIAESKVLVNVHYDQDYQIFEHMRCDRWILSGLLVISETSLSDSLLDCQELLITETYDHLVETIVQVVTNYDTYYRRYMERLIILKPSIVETRRRACQQFFDHLKV